ncbi:MAG TPA: hypothetical protein PKD85_09065, partial [Saprospiraceae bacterium]|nr:hypothetical protein [Saprospiraceae bacterium]
AIIGSVGSLRSTHLEVKSFHQMNLGWGIINAGIASLGYYSALKGGTIPLESMSLLQENQSLKSILLLNTGLDVAYMISGVYLIEKDKNSIKNPGRLRGFGKSLIMQGAFLFVFDLGMYINFNSQTKDIIKLFSQNGAIGLSYTF